MTSVLPTNPDQPMSQNTNADLAINGLIYKQPNQVSKAVVRTTKRQRFQRRSYLPQEVGRCDFNSGSDYVNCSNSYLTFDIATTGGEIATGNFGTGSVMNIIERIIITSRSGTELDRIERANLYSKNTLKYEKSDDWVRKYGSMMLLGETGSTETDGPIISDVAQRVCIPLNAFAGIFNPINEQLMPPHLASGLQIEILFADYRTAIVQTGVGSDVTGYTVENIQFALDCVTLSDDTQKTLNMEAAQSGLEYTYPRVYTSTNSIQSTSVNAQVRKAVSQACKVTSTLISQAAVLEVGSDSLESVAWDVSTWQYRLGGLYFPQESLSDPTGVESFLSVQNAFNKSQFSFKENAISVEQFQNTGNNGGYGVMCQSLERDQVLNLTGMPINNSRVLELTATLGTYTFPLELVTFLDYFVVARAYTDNCLLSL